MIKVSVTLKTKKQNVLPQKSSRYLLRTFFRPVMDLIVNFIILLIIQRRILRVTFLPRLQKSLPRTKKIKNYVAEFLRKTSLLFHVNCIMKLIFKINSRFDYIFIYAGWRLFRF